MITKPSGLLKLITKNLLGRIGLEPGLYKLDGTVNVAWITWWCKQHDVPFNKGQIAWAVTAIPYEEPEFNDPAWFEWFGNKGRDVTLEEIEHNRKICLRDKASFSWLPEPPLLINYDKINFDWLSWYQLKACCRGERALLAAKKAAIKAGVITNGVINPTHLSCKVVIDYALRD